MATASKTAPETQSQYKVIGTRPIRHDGVDKVTGRAQYGADVYLTGMLHGNVLRSPHAHARIVSIDTAKALALPGVKAVVTGRDLPDPGDKIANLGEASAPLRHLSLNVLARDKVLYQGHAVAAVAATDPHLAEEAAGLIEVEYELLPPVMDVMEAMKDGAPLLDENLRTKSFGTVGDQPTNVADHIHFELGDVEQGFAEADVVVEREFTTQTVHQGYIEPHNCTAFWNSDGQLTIWLSTQGSFTSRAQTSEILGVPISQVKVVPTEIGGGFGGKIATYLEPTAALLSKATGRPVKILMTREEVLQATGPTPASFMRVKMGARKDGTLTAGSFWAAFDAGGFPGIAHRRRLHVRVRTLQPAQRSHRRLRRAGQQAQVFGLPRPGRDPRRVRLRDRRGRDLRDPGHGPHRIPPSRTPPRRATGGSTDRSGRGSDAWRRPKPPVNTPITRRRWKDPTAAAAWPAASGSTWGSSPASTPA